MKAPDKKAIMAKKALLAKKAMMARKAKATPVRRRRRIRQTFDRFVVLATDLNNVPKDSTGWTASLTSGATVVTADFDEFGVVRFPTISTLTTVSYILRIRDSAGNQLVQRNIPPNREFYVARF